MNIIQITPTRSPTPPNFMSTNLVKPLNLVKPKLTSHTYTLMASKIPTTNPLHFSLTHKKTHLFIPSFPSISLKPPNSNFTLKNPTSHFHIYPHPHPNFLLPRTTQKGISVTSNNDPKVPIFEEKQQLKPVKTVLWVLFWASVSLAVYAFSKGPKASAIALVSNDSSIKASNFGFKIANSLRGLGWPDEFVVLSLATLPVIELRGAIPVGYWMQLNPTLLTLLSIFGNMIPVPFIILYLKKFATFLAGKNRALSRFLDMLFERAKNKAGPVEEFQWLGLMLFVAVPFPGTGAWTGAIIASVLDMPFWPAMSANFFGVVLAGLLVNLLVNLGLKYAVITGVILFFVSTFMWSILRSLSKSLNTPK